MGILRELFKTPQLEPKGPFPIGDGVLYWQPDRSGILLVSRSGGGAFLYTRRKGWKPHSQQVETDALEQYTYDD